MITRRDNMRGFSVLELAVAVAIVGVAIVCVLGVMASKTGSGELLRARASLSAARSALASFAFVHSRLPCPAKTTKGREACDGSTSGYLPFSTLGMVDETAGHFHYELPSAALTKTGGGATVLVIALSDGGPGAWPRYEANSAPVATVVDAALYDHKLDFCAALEEGSQDRSVATLTAAASSSGSPTSSEVLTAAAASGQLGCSGLLATAARSHYATGLAAAAMSNSFVDYKAQFDVSYDLYLWDLTTGVWGAADSAASFGKSATKTSLALSAWLETDMLDFEPLLSLVSLGTSIGGYAKGVSNLARFTYNMVVAHENRVLFAQINDHLIDVNGEIQANVALDAAIGNVVGYQGLAPPTPRPPSHGPVYDGSNPLGQTAKDFIGALGGSPL